MKRGKRHITSVEFEYDEFLLEKLKSNEDIKKLYIAYDCRGNTWQEEVPGKWLGEGFYDLIERDMLLMINKTSNGEYILNNDYAWRANKDYYLLKIEKATSLSKIYLDESLIDQGGLVNYSAVLVSCDREAAFNVSKFDPGFVVIVVMIKKELFHDYLYHHLPSDHPIILKITGTDFISHHIKINQVMLDILVSMSHSEFMLNRHQCMLKSYLFRLLHEYFTLLKKEQTNGIKPIKMYDQQIISYAIEAIYNSSKMPPSIKEISRTSYISERKFEMLFKSVHGTSYYQFFIRYRMNKAKELLLKGQYSVSEVAYMVGYEHLGNFSKMFRRIHGYLPSEIIPK
ncbi:MAG TPA: helix-turn-helix transcriptional regulator [Chitinophaga sp.]|uniref:helix-turn-helix domain-containing protein n=1 Tax=Chitinophaga sp. TaxID=1869181 RepID=UPI002CEE3E63|nr:helix-turn-helix transcriptional regulator [Chitinophaga sp.]HVI46049.1 helix-turn-helix transcriptional regulator [Chitinophaga sp.]